jgi:hypothetical protein
MATKIEIMWSQQRKLGLNFIIFVKNGTELAVFEK